MKASTISPSANVVTASTCIEGKADEIVRSTTNVAMAVLSDGNHEVGEIALPPPSQTM